MSYYSPAMKSRLFSGWNYLTMGDAVAFTEHAGGDGWEISSVNVAPHDVTFSFPDVDIKSMQYKSVGTKVSLERDIEQLITYLPARSELCTKKLIAHLEKHIEFYLGKSIFYKIGLSQLFRGNAHINAGLNVHLIPIPNWIEQSFNRRMVYLDNTDQYKGRPFENEEEQYLSEEREDGLQYLFRGFGHLRFTFPNVLHIDLSVITSDSYLICLEKRLHSDYAKIGRRKTASLERSFVVDKHLVIGSQGQTLIDCYKAALQGLSQELGVRENELEEISLQSLIIESPNLNTGFTGVCKVSVSESEIRLRLRRSGTFPHRYGMPVHISDVTDKYLETNCIEENHLWHPASQIRSYYAREWYNDKPKAFISCCNSNCEFAYKMSEDLRRQGVFTFDFRQDVQSVTARYANIAEFMRVRIEECFRDPNGKIVIFANPEYKEKADNPYGENYDKGVVEEITIVQDMISEFPHSDTKLLFICTDETLPPNRQLPTKYRKMNALEVRKFEYDDLLDVVASKIKRI